MDDSMNIWLQIVSYLEHIVIEDKRENCYSPTEYPHIFATKGPEVKYRTYGTINNEKVLLYKGSDLEKALEIREEYDNFKTKEKEDRIKKSIEKKENIKTGSKERQHNPWRTPTPSVRWY